MGTSSHVEPDRSPSLYADSLFDGRGGAMQFKWRRRWLASTLLHISAHSATNFNKYAAILMGVMEITGVQWSGWGWGWLRARRKTYDDTREAYVEFQKNVEAPNKLKT